MGTLFFETFPVILIDQTSTVRADIAFRLFGHLWHASRAIFQDIWTGVNLNHKQNKNMVEMKS